MSNVIVSSANLNLPIRRAMLGGHESHAEFLHQTGYDGFEIHPARSRLTAEILLGTKAIDLVTSLHQSFQDANLRDIITGKKHPSIQAIAFAGALPDRKALNALPWQHTSKASAQGSSRTLPRTAGDAPHI